jgi:hypothetical protein
MKILAKKVEPLSDLEKQLVKKLAAKEGYDSEEDYMVAAVRIQLLSVLEEISTNLCSQLI